MPDLCTSLGQRPTTANAYGQFVEYALSLRSILREFLGIIEEMLDAAIIRV